MTGQPSARATPAAYPREPVRCVAASAADAAALLAVVERAGYRPRRGFPVAPGGIGGAPDGPADPAVMLVGPVPDARTAEAVLSAAARGTSVLAVVDPAAPVGRAVLAGLGRLGPVRLAPVAARTLRVPGQPAGPRLVPEQRALVERLVPEQRALLDRLANGETIAAAAAAEFLSLRTANRRIAGVRHLFGVRTTREAVRFYLRQRGSG
ncbi:LuxR family transcriptional regulator [Plantactinospora sp. GCM10030261]|uniref:LuxR family transcriptional regulator n=1 Tax=Plantactinospora sp. GCM10030261 TaxID=3273420 RepID=UPI003609CE8E